MSESTQPDPRADAVGDRPSQTDPEGNGPEANGPVANGPVANGDGVAQVASAGQLAAARAARGWSPSDVASKLGMVPRQIEAIERGDWGALPGQAFVRGAIRAYGKALQVDVEPLVASVGGTVRAAELRPSASLEAPMPRRGALGFDNGGSGSRLTWVLLGVLGVIAIAMYFGRGAQWSQVLEDGAADPGAAGRAIEAVPVRPQGAPPESIRPQSPPSSQSPSSQSSPSPAPPPGDASSTAPGSLAAAAQSGSAGATGQLPAAIVPASAGPAPAGAVAALRFRFEQAAWVEVRDGGGKLLLHGMQPAGSTREIAGRRPYSLVVGNAVHVRLDHGGRDIELGALARQGVARLKID